jgi:hypothetical protein
MRSLPPCRFLAALAFLLLAVVPALAQPPARTHVGANASDLVTLVTETSPTEAGVIAPLSFSLRADGSATPFSIPADAVLVVTDVTVTMPRNNAAAGRYVAAICNTPCIHSRVPIEVVTAADGFQKTIAFTGGVVFANQPQFETLAGNPSEMSVRVYGYLARRR